MVDYGTGRDECNIAGYEARILGTNPDRFIADSGHRNERDRVANNIVGASQQEPRRHWPQTAISLSPSVLAITEVNACTMKLTYKNHKQAGTSAILLEQSKNIDTSLDRFGARIEEQTG